MLPFLYYQVDVAFIWDPSKFLRRSAFCPVGQKTRLSHQNQNQRLDSGTPALELNKLYYGPPWFPLALLHSSVQGRQLRNLTKSTVIYFCLNKKISLRRFETVLVPDNNLTTNIVAKSVLQVCVSLKDGQHEKIYISGFMY